MNVQSCRALLWALVALTTACGPTPDKPLDVASASAASLDSAPPDVVAETARAVAYEAERMAVADSIASRLVFAPRTQTWFTAAARGKRMLADIGRVDIEVRRDSARKKIYQALVAKQAPVRIGQRLRLRGPWGAEDVTVTAFDTWNGRIVAVLAGSPRLDSLARVVDPLPASVIRADTAAPVAPDTCARDSVPALLLERALTVRDSLDMELRETQMPVYERLLEQVNVTSSQVPGCFGNGRLLLIVSLRAGNFEHVRERYVVLDDSGTVHPLVRGAGYRFKAHDAVYAFDADGDGTDDVAARGRGPHAGGTVILRVNRATQRLERLTSGFAWEQR